MIRRSFTVAIYHHWHEKFITKASNRHISRKAVLIINDAGRGNSEEEKLWNGITSFNGTKGGKKFSKLEYFYAIFNFGIEQLFSPPSLEREETFRHSQKKNLWIMDQRQKQFIVLAVTRCSIYSPRAFRFFFFTCYEANIHKTFQFQFMFRYGNSSCCVINYAEWN